MKRARLTVHGKVQGVFYRDHVRKEASKFKINGYVKNMKDGTVEVVAECSDEDNLKKFIEQCKKGSFMAFVQNVDVTEEEATGEFEDFDIRH